MMSGPDSFSVPWCLCEKKENEWKSGISRSHRVTEVVE